MSLIKYVIALSPVVAYSLPHEITPASGVVLDQLQKQYEIQEIVPIDVNQPAIDIEPSQKKLKLCQQKAFIEEIFISGVTVYSSGILEAIYEPYLNQSLTIEKIQKLCAEIQAKYASDGYFLAKVYAKQQDIEDNRLYITVLEGTLGEITTEGEKNYSSKFLKSYFTHLQNKPLQYDPFLRAILLLNENTDLDAKTVLKKGKEAGVVDVVLKIQDKKPVHATLDYNNYGSKSNSKTRLGLKADFGNLFKEGDTLRLIEVMGSSFKRLNFSDILYSLPLNTSGTRFESGYLFSKFHGGRHQDPVLSGNSHVAMAKVSQAWHRSRKFNSDFFVSFEHKQIKNYVESIFTSFDKLRVLSTGVHASYIDQFQGKNMFAVSFHTGLPHILGGLHARDPMASRFEGGGRFYKAVASAKRLQSVLQNSFVYLSFVGQYGFDRLPLSEQMYIGGIDTVRGYSLAKGVGDFGYHTTLEFRTPLSFLKTFQKGEKKGISPLQLTCFLDHGQTYNHGQSFQLNEIGTTANGSVIKEPVTYQKTSHLISAGVGFRFFGPYQSELSVDVGFPLKRTGESKHPHLYFKIAIPLY